MGYVASEIIMWPLFQVPRLTNTRMAAAISVALLADAIQIGLGPAGFFLIDQVGDVFAMALISWAIGFHPLLLPTFLIELIPGVVMIPTWTGCTLAVLALRKRAGANQTPCSDSAGGPPPIKPANVLHDGPPEPK
jgi:hypothetical protein